MILCVQSEDFKKSDSAAQGQPNKCIRLQKFKSAWSFDRAIRVSPFLLNLFGPAPRFNHHHDIFGMQSSKLGLKLVGGLGTGAGLLRTRTCYDLMDLHTPTMGIDLRTTSTGFCVGNRNPSIHDGFESCERVSSAAASKERRLYLGTLCE